LLEDREPNRKTLWMVVLYKPIGATAVGHTAIFDTLAERFTPVDAAFAVAELNATDRAVLIRKRDFKAIPDLDIACMSHKVWLFARGNIASHKRIVLTFAQCCVRSRTNLEIVPADPGTLTFEQVLAATSRLDPADLRALRGSIVVKAPDERTESDRAVLRCLPLIAEVRKDREPLGDSSLFWKVSNPPMNIAPQRYFMNLGLVGRRLIGQDEAGVQTFMECPLEHLLNNVEILREHAVVFMGADSTTGYGKSTIARFLAAKFAVHMTTVLNRPKTEATVLSSTTLDDLSGVSCRSGWAVMLDELDVGDKDAIQYMSTTIMKAMADPQSTAGLRARGTNVRLAGDTARIFTTNATSLEDWAAGRFVITLPIRRKMFVFVIEQKLIEEEWAKRADYVGSELFCFFCCFSPLACRRIRGESKPGDAIRALLLPERGRMASSGLFFPRCRSGTRPPTYRKQQT
jgi:hypothetical protein